MTCQTKIDGSWREISNNYVKVDGTWRNINKTFVKINGVWRNTCNNSPTGVIYGVKIDTTNPNPDLALTYIEDSKNFIPASGNNGLFSYGSWQDKFPFNKIKPCVIKNGVKQYYLNPNDYTKKEDGTNADITSGNDGDVMVEFPKVYWKFERVGTDLYIRYSDIKIDDTYRCLAHIKNGVEKSNIYIGAYLGFSSGNKLRSLSGKVSSSYLTIDDIRTLAKENGENYEQMTYYSLLMLQVLYLVMFKSRNSQSALGYGNVGYQTPVINTGGTNSKSLFYGETTGRQQLKFCGIEDFYGNKFYFIDGVVTDDSYNILIGNDNFNNNGIGYTNHGRSLTSYTSSYIKDVMGSTETGFIIKNEGGSDSTYYADHIFLSNNSISCFGGYSGNGNYVGSFRLLINQSHNYYDSITTGRLIMYGD